MDNYKQAYATPYLTTRLTVCSEDWEPPVRGAAVKIEDELVQQEYCPPASDHPDPVTFDGVVKEKQSSELRKKKAVFFPLSSCSASDSAAVSLSDLTCLTDVISSLWSEDHLCCALHNAIRADWCVQQDGGRSWDNTASQQSERTERTEHNTPL